MQSIARGEERKNAAQILISQVIPCIMHLENRVGEKLITVLLSIGAELYQKHNSRGLLQLVKGVQDLVNTRLLGTLMFPKQWRTPLGEKNDTVLKVSLSNVKTRQFMENIGVLIDFCFPEPEDAEP
jgi:hypothetical protein